LNFIQGSIKTINTNSLGDITTIRGYTFAECSYLKSITIPSSVTAIEEGAFYSCYSLENVTVLNPTPPTLGDDAFYSTSTRLVIYVPASSVSAYQTAWSDYSSKIQALPN
jgi:hypothetical protein